MGGRPSKDMAICFVFFNPVGSKRMLMNYLYVANRYKREGYPVFTMELTFNKEYEIPDAFHVKSKSFMFHKERLCRLLEAKIPSKYTKLLFLDADVLFETMNWYSDVSKLLDTYDVVQPFEFAHWMDLTYTQVTLSRETVVKMDGPSWNFKYHPGFAWAMRRDWYRKVGFFDWAVSGSGDTLSSAAWLRKDFPEKFASLPKALQKEYKKFQSKPRPRITYHKGGHVFHLYHGARQNRQYSERHKLLEVEYDIRSLIKFNWYGAYEWTQPTIWNPIFHNYFAQRQDDDLGENSIREQWTS